MSFLDRVHYMVDIITYPTGVKPICHAVYTIGFEVLLDLLNTRCIRVRKVSRLQIVFKCYLLLTHKTYSSERSWNRGLSPRLFLQALVDRKRSQQSWRIQPQFRKKVSVISHPLGSQGSFHTMRPVSPFASAECLGATLDTLLPHKSWQSLMSSIKSPARMRLSRSLGMGIKSSQGWWGTKRWISVGCRAGGKAAPFKWESLGLAPLNMDSESSSNWAGIYPRTSKLECSARIIFNLVNPSRSSAEGDPKVNSRCTRSSSWGTIRS